jgi:hypothetical protein
MAHSRTYKLIIGWAVILLAAGLYLATLDTGLRPDELSGGDLITHQYAQVQARPSNAPGYPLYTMGGWLWFRLSRPLLGWVLNPVQRLSSYSTLWALLSLFVLYRLSLRATHGNWPIASLSTVFYAATYFFWFYSVTTEQYTSAVFQTLLIVWLAFRWDEEVAQGRNGQMYLFGLAFAIGTCLANLVTTLFILPALLWFILSRRPGLLRQPGLVVRAAALALLPVTSYAYVYLRGATHPEWRGTGVWPDAWSWFIDFITTQQGRDELAPGLTLSHFFTAEYPALIWGELTCIVLVGGLIGVWWLGRRRALFLYATLGIYLSFCWVDRFGNWFQVIIPAYPLIVLGFATCLNALWEKRRTSVTWTYGMRSLIMLGLLTLVGYRFMLSLPRADQSNRPQDTGLEPGWAVLADRPLAKSLVVGTYDEWLALQYLAYIWGADPVVDPRPLCQANLAGTDGRSQTLSPVSAVYITRRAAAEDPACLADQHHYAAGANLIQVQATRNTQVPGSAQDTSLEFGPRLALAGVEVHPSPHAKTSGKASQSATSAGPSTSGWHISLYWRANDSMDTNYTVSVRPLRDGQLITGEDGKPLIQDHQPVWDSYPTTRWSPGEIVRDDYVISLPNRALPNGVQIVVYRITNGGFENLAEANLVLPP